MSVHAHKIYVRSVKVNVENYRLYATHNIPAGNRPTVFSASNFMMLDVYNSRGTVALF